MTRARWIAVTVVLLAAAAIAMVLLVSQREPPPPDPFALTPDGLYQVPVSRTTDGVDPCSLLTAEEVRIAYDQSRVRISREPDDPQFCFYAGDEGGINVYTGATIEGLTEEGSGFTTTTIAGRPALVEASTGEVDCVVVMVVDAVPGRPGLRIRAVNANSCSIPLRLAELAVSRLPAAP